MKKIMFSILMLAAVFALQANERPVMLLANGTILRNVKLTKVDHRGLCFVHSDGFIHVKPKELSKMDQRLFANDIKTYNQKVREENLRIRKVRQARALAKRKEREAYNAKRKALQDMFDEELAMVKERGVENYYLGCLRLERRWRGKLINRNELRKMKKEGWEQKLNNPTITNKNRLAYLLLLDKIILRYRYAVANDKKWVPAHNRIIKEFSSQFGKLTMDEVIIFFWQHSKLEMFYNNALEYMEVSEKNETRNTGKELRNILAGEKKFFSSFISRYGLNIKDVENMSPSSADISEVTGALQSAIACKSCKGRGFIEGSSDGGDSAGESAEAPAENAEGGEGGEDGEGKPAPKKAKRASGGAPKIDLAYSDKAKEIKAEPCMACKSIGAILPKESKEE